MLPDTKTMPQQQKQTQQKRKKNCTRMFFLTFFFISPLADFSMTVALLLVRAICCDFVAVFVSHNQHAFVEVN